MNGYKKNKGKKKVVTHHLNNNPYQIECINLRVKYVLKRCYLRIIITGEKIHVVNIFFLLSKVIRLIRYEKMCIC